MAQDVRLSGVGSSVVMVEPVSQEAKDWVQENVGLEGWQWMGPAFAVEPRMLDNLIAGMEDAGLSVE